MNFDFFSKNLAEFAKVDLGAFLFNLFVATVLSTLLRIFYIRYGNAISNRKRFASNFLPLTLTTMLIISIIRSSIELSLGLVGALSMVRFRAAIKDPEELTYLFLVIGIGLGTGANQSIIAFIAVLIILFFLWLHKKAGGKRFFKEEDKLYVNVSTDLDNLDQITKILEDNLSYVELKRLDTLEKGMDISYICKAKSIAEISLIKTTLTALSPQTRLSVIDQPDLII
ncbi:MAG: DUF4956 domain-containing protein [Saprospiraceae bacterium]|nr:DUF4956 domain-containing protein [Saprospiraceae bacterium]